MHQTGGDDSRLDPSLSRHLERARLRPRALAHRRHRGGNPVARGREPARVRRGDRPRRFQLRRFLRAGAIAKLSPGTKELRRFASEGGAILGSCNGFQILCEAGLLPGALIRNSDLAYRSDWVPIRVESEETPFTRGFRGAVLRMPIRNG